jgi:putative DNA primase/helicase
MSQLYQQMFYRMSEMTPRPVEWAWNDLISMGKLTLLTGDPGIGKSLVARQVAAMVTRGVKNPRDLLGDVPDSLSTYVAENRVLRSGVLVLSAADDPEETFLPQLIAAGADPSRVFFLKGRVVDEPIEADDTRVIRPFRLSQDVDNLQWCIEELNEDGINIDLIVIDSIDRYIGANEKKSDRIEVVAQLADLAKRTHAAILVTTNTSMKSGCRGGTVVYQGRVDSGTCIVGLDAASSGPSTHLVWDAASCL